MPKNMMLASPLSRTSQTSMYFGEPPASQAASRECEAPKNVEDSASGGNLPRSSPEHGSGARASRTMRTTRKPYKALRRCRLRLS